MLGIEYIRNYNNLTMDELADVLAVTKQSISQWENRKSRIPSKRLIQLSEYFRIPEVYFEKDLTEIDKVELEKILLENKIKDLKEDAPMEEVDNLSCKIQELGRSARLLRLTERINRSIEQKDQSKDFNNEHLYTKFTGLIESNRVDRLIFNDILSAVETAFIGNSNSDAFINELAELLKNYGIERRKQIEESKKIFKNVYTNKNRRIMKNSN